MASYRSGGRYQYHQHRQWNYQEPEDEDGLSFNEWLLTFLILTVALCVMAFLIGWL